MRHHLPHLGRFNSSPFTGKRSRTQFESTHNQNHNNTSAGNTPFEAPSKRPKLSHQSFHPNHSNNNTYNNNTYNNENEPNNTKQRNFQNHESKLQSNGRKTRQETRLQNRKLQRKFGLQQKYQNAIKSQLTHANYWTFNIGTNNQNSHMHTHHREPSVESVDDDDQHMTDHSKYTNYIHCDYSHSHYSSPYKNKPRSFIPQTCPPNLRKYNSYPQRQSQTQTTQNMNNTHINNENIDTNSERKQFETFEQTNITENECKMESDTQNRARESELRRKREQRRSEREEQIRVASEKRIAEMRDNRASEKETERRKSALRERIHPMIISRAHPVRNSPILLIKLFYPKSRISKNANRKDINKAFKRALASFHPDRTVNKSMKDQIIAEETFKVLSDAMDRFNKECGENGNRNRNGRQKKQRRSGWF